MEIMNALDFIEDCFEAETPEKLQLEKIACHVHLSLSHFKLRFTKETGYTPWKYICERRIELAKDLLKNGLSITEIAFQLGYASSQHFCSSFKSYTGDSPTVWSKKYRKL